MKKEKRILIITWFNRGVNYGQILQAFAIQRGLFKLGYSSSLLDYRSKSKTFEEWKQSILSNMQRSKISFIIFQNRYLKKTKRFSNQEDVISFIKESDFMCYISGSDQIWNPDADFDKLYFLAFPKGNGIKLSFASSVAKGKFTKENRRKYEKMSHWLDDFNQISVREYSTVPLIAEYTKNRVQWVLDPVFLLTGSEWKGFCKEFQCIKGAYAFIYTLGDKKYYTKVIEDIIKRNPNLQIVRVQRTGTRFEIENYFKKTIAPLEFVHLIQNAELVITDSFHGVAFSINLNKKFWVIQRKEDMPLIPFDRRVEDLLHIFSLENRIYKMKKEDDKIEELSFDMVNEILVRERKRAITYIKNGLKL